MTDPDYSQRLRHVIPGGAHTYSRGDDQYPSNAPRILARGQGVHVFDPGGSVFLDYGMALRAVNIGYAEPYITAAAVRQIEKGNNLTRPSLIELEAAELLTDLVDSVDMVKFTKNGSTAVTAAPSTRSSPTTTGSSDRPRLRAASPTTRLGRQSSSTTTTSRRSRRSSAATRASLPASCSNPR
jgi:hypothetical protein